jgi:hypothetical protein
MRSGGHHDPHRFSCGVTGPELAAAPFEDVVEPRDD